MVFGRLLRLSAVLLIGLLGLSVTAEAKGHRSHPRHHRHGVRHHAREFPGRVTYHIPRGRKTAFGKRANAGMAAVNNFGYFPKGSTVQLLMPNRHDKMVVVASGKVADKMAPRFRAMARPCVDFYCASRIPKPLRLASGKTCRLRVIYPT